MTDLQNLFEYVYEESDEIQAHGLHGILEYINTPSSTISSSDLKSVSRVCSRILSELQTGPPHAKYYFATCLLLRLSVFEESDQVDPAVVERSLVSLSRLCLSVNHETPIQRDVLQRFLCALLALTLRLSDLQPVQRPSDPDSLVSALLVIAESFSYNSSRSMSLALLNNLSVVLDNHHSLLNANVIPTLERYLSCFPQSLENPILKMLYNLSFSPLLSPLFSLELYVGQRIRNPFAIRIVINLFKSWGRKEQQSRAMELATACIDFLAKTSTCSSELLFLLQLSSNRLSKLDRQSFIESEKDTLDAILHHAIQGEEILMLKAWQCWDQAGVTEDSLLPQLQAWYDTSSNEDQLVLRSFLPT